jgi:hypothetical protein
MALRILILAFYYVTVESKTKGERVNAASSRGSWFSHYGWAGKAGPWGQFVLTNSLFFTAGAKGSTRDAQGGISAGTCLARMRNQSDATASLDRLIRWSHSPAYNNIRADGLNSGDGVLI